MIALNKQSTRRVNKRKAMQQAHQMSQITINAVLWQIIRQNAETNEEDFDSTKSAVLTVPMEDFKGVPQDFGLQVKQDKDGNIVIVASGVESKSGLILPDKKIIEG